MPGCRFVSKQWLLPLGSFFKKLCLVREFVVLTDCCLYLDSEASPRCCCCCWLSPVPPSAGSAAQSCETWPCGSGTKPGREREKERWLKDMVETHSIVKRLWLGAMLTQHTVRRAFRPAILPIENLQGNYVPAVFQKIQPYPGRDLNPGSWGLEHSTPSIVMWFVIRAGHLRFLRKRIFKTREMTFKTEQDPISTQLCLLYNSYSYSYSY